MQQQDTTPATVCRLFPPMQRQALVRAAQRGDMREIDAITDELARLGLVRPRHDDRPSAPAVMAAALAGWRGA